MSDADRSDAPTPDEGSTTPLRGTPMAVEVAGDREARRAIARLLIGPVVWFAHFMLVYLVSEAGCTGGGEGLRVFDPPVPTVVTLAATVVATLACLAFAAWEYRRWRASGEEHSAPRARERSAELEEQATSGMLHFVGLLLAVISLLSVLFVGLPALVLPSC